MRITHSRHIFLIHFLPPGWPLHLGANGCFTGRFISKPTDLVRERDYHPNKTR